MIQNDFQIFEHDFLGCKCVASMRIEVMFLWFISINSG